MSIKVLATIGPTSIHKDVIERMSSKGVSLFRINLSHTKLVDLENVIRKIQSWTDVPICLDSEGAQVRNQDMQNDLVYYKEGSTVTIHQDQVIGDCNNISFTPNSVVQQLRVGDTIRVDFNAVTFMITNKYTDYLLASVESPGNVGSNKAADVDHELELDAVTYKDKKAFEIGLKYGINNFSLSFTNTVKDVDEVREVIGHNTNLISKIESIKGVMNLGEILPAVDQILIDRGDLSREVPIEKIPFLQRRINSYAKSKNTPVFVATNLLESMITTISPTRAEVNDVASTLLMGADGLVLAAETAVGIYPTESVNMVFSLIEQFNRWTPDTTFNDIIFN